MTPLLVAILLVGLSAPSYAFAQKKGQSLELLEAKARIEEQITQRMKSAIATQLEKEDFDVSAQVELSQVKPKKDVLSLESNVKSESSPKSLDLSVGLVDADSLIRKYKTDLNEAREREFILLQRAASEGKPEFQVRSVTVEVGLKPTFGAEYAKELELWVKKRLTADFGSSASAKVSVVRNSPKESETQKSILDQLSKFQSLIGFGLLALATILSVVLMKSMASKDAMENRRLTAQLQQHVRLQQEETKALVSDTEIEEDPAEGTSGLELEAIRELQGKVVWSLSDNTARMNEVLSGWLESGDRGLYKAACLIDILISARGRPEGEAFSTHLEWSQAVPLAFQKRMRDTFENMSRLAAVERIRLIEEVYWDFVSVKTLGVNALKKPFQFVSSIPVNEVKVLLASQQPQIRALVVLHMNEDSREDYLKGLPYESKREIVEETLQMEKILSTDIEAASETLKFTMRQNQDELRTVSIKSMAPKIFGSMSTLEETKLLKDISTRISDGALSIKRTYPTLAFIDSWPEPLLKMIFASAPSDEVTALFRVLPEVKDLILPLCPPRVREIVQGDLIKADQLSDEAKEKQLSSLKLRLLQVVNRESLDLEAIFPEPSSHGGGVRAAS